MKNTEKWVVQHCTAFLLCILFANVTFSQPPLSLNDWKVEKQGETFILRPHDDTDFVYTIYRQTPFKGQDLGMVFKEFVCNVARDKGSLETCSNVKNTNSTLRINECTVSIKQGTATGIITFIGYAVNGKVRYCSVSYPEPNKERKRLLNQVRQHFIKVYTYDCNNLSIMDLKLWTWTAFPSMATNVLPKDSLCIIPRKSVMLFDSNSISKAIYAIEVAAYRRKTYVNVRTRKLNIDRINDLALLNAKNNDYYILIEKSKYSLSVCDSTGWLISYPVVFGTGGESEKQIEGDKKTPEGSFHILDKHGHDKWSKFMLLDYPTKEDLANFKVLKESKRIPEKAVIGGGIGIHGTWPHDDFMIDYYKNWTDGCISMKNDDIDDLYKFVHSGMLVVIKK